MAEDRLGTALLQNSMEMWAGLREGGGQTRQQVLRARREALGETGPAGTWIPDFSLQDMRDERLWYCAQLLKKSNTPALSMPARGHVLPCSCWRWDSVPPTSLPISQRPLCVQPGAACAGPAPSL